MRNAFTLIELLVVIVLLALLASLTIFSLRGTIDRQQMSRAIETVEMFDARARRTARSAQHAITAVIDSRHGQLSVSMNRESQDIFFRLPNRVTVSDLRLGKTSVRDSESKIEINGQGRSPTYAIQLQRGELKQWLVVLGFSGQVVASKNEGEVDAILSL